MKRTRFPGEQINGVLKEAEVGTPTGCGIQVSSFLQFSARVGFENFPIGISFGSLLPCPRGEVAAMVRLGKLMMILELHRQGVSITAIARRTARDPKTACKYIERGIAAPVYGLRATGEAARREQPVTRTVTARMGKARMCRQIEGRWGFCALSIGNICSLATATAGKSQ